MDKRKNMTASDILEKMMHKVIPLPSQMAYATDLATIFSMHIHRNQLMDQGYCDYKNPYLQQIMRVKLDRWAGNSLPRKTKREIHSILLKGGEQKTVFSTTQGSCNELCIELYLESTERDEIDLKIFARFGGRIAIEYYKEV